MGSNLQNIHQLGTQYGPIVKRNRGDPAVGGYGPQSSVSYPVCSSLITPAPAVLRTTCNPSDYWLSISYHNTDYVNINTTMLQWFAIRCTRLLKTDNIYDNDNIATAEEGKGEGGGFKFGGKTFSLIGFHDWKSANCAASHWYWSGQSPCIVSLQHLPKYLTSRQSQFVSYAEQQPARWGHPAPIPPVSRPMLTASPADNGQDNIPMLQLVDNPRLRSWDPWLRQVYNFQQRKWCKHQ